MNISLLFSEVGKISRKELKVIESTLPKLTGPQITLAFVILHPTMNTPAKDIHNKCSAICDLIQAQDKDGVVQFLEREPSLKKCLTEDDVWPNARCSPPLHYASGINATSMIKFLIDTCQARVDSRYRGSQVGRSLRLINLEIPVLVRSLKSNNVELG